MFKRFIIIAVIIFFSAGSCFAASVGNTSDPKTPYGPGVANMQKTGLGPFKVSIDINGVFKKELSSPDSDVGDPEFEGQWYLGRIGYTFADRVEPYLKFGAANLKTKWTERIERDHSEEDIKVASEIGFAIGGGAKMLIFDMPEYRIRMTADAQCLYTDPGVDKVKVNVPNRSVSATEFKVLEWQASGVISIELPFNYDRKDPTAVYSVIPYLGAGYADSEIQAEFNFDNRSYSLGKAKNRLPLFVITGMDIVAPKNVVFNVEGRWVGETSASGGCTVKF